MSKSQPIKRALISVSDKSGIVDFAKQLVQLNVEIMSTGGTYSLLKENQIPAFEVSEYTEFPEIMAGRVKTLHPKIHGGILGRRGTDENIMVDHNIKAIDLVVVNLYPFQATVANPDCSLDIAIENIDIGGPAMLRSAAKNHAAVTVVVDNKDYPKIIAEFIKQGATSQKTRFHLACKAFEHTACYDGAIANYLGTQMSLDSQFPRTFSTQLVKVQDMRYGENPHQQAAFYVEHNPKEASIATSQQVQGKELSYNNIADTDAALECVKTFQDPTCVIVKHANPCGVATANDITEAYERAYKTDPTSAFGGIIAFNRKLDVSTAQRIIDRQFVEVIIAPNLDDAAKQTLQRKPNVRVLTCGELPQHSQPELDYKRVTGGILVQDRDLGAIAEADLRIVSERMPSEAEFTDLQFAWKVAKYVKSNAIVYCKNGMTIGIGAGQMSRVYSAKIAGIKAEDEGLQVAGSVMASDAFLPFCDAIDAAAKVGITAIIQPGGSMRDEDIIASANAHNIAMLFTGMRHFRH